MGEENKIWKKGDQGEKVTWIQTRLKELEYLERNLTVFLMKRQKKPCGLSSRIRDC